MRAFLSEGFRKGRIKLDRGRKPYLKKLCSISKIEVWMVDGEYVRKNICEDFVNYSHHYHLEFIPKNEFWIADGADPEEIRYYIDHLIAEYRLMASGMGYRKASEKAAIAEKRERNKSEAMKKLSGIRENKKELVEKVHKRLLKSYSGAVKVWVVDGRLVRDLFYFDFAGGGHDRVYHFIPDNEVWIDDDISREERKFIILHELHERNMMSGGMEYTPAHSSATGIEDFFRHHPKRIDKAIREEIRKQDVQK
jgi:hypothetical protein